ncbi:MAG: glycosyltransferase family 2 protein [Kiritimatiellae bacterium]|nr:glycosyltransferase family 2 protein [Kiritimatiellia bacterium]
MPFYNTEELIKVSVASLLAQTNKSFEIIFVNDGSTDDTKVILEQLLSNSEIYFTILDKENGGVSSARNYGISHARGRYVMFLDADDCVVEHLVERLSVSIKDNPDMVLSGHDVVSSDFKVIHRNSVSGYNGYESGTKLFQDVLKRKLVIDVKSLLLRKDFIHDINLVYNIVLPFGEDLEFNLLALYRANRVNVIDEQLSFYIRHEKSTTSRLFNISWYGYYISRYDKVLDCIEDGDIINAKLVCNAKVGAAAYIYSCICLENNFKGAMGYICNLKKQYLSKIDNRSLEGKYKYMYVLMYHLSAFLYVLLKYRKFSIMWSEKIFEPVGSEK